LEREREISNYDGMSREKERVKGRRRLIVNGSSFIYLGFLVAGGVLATW